MAVTGTARARHKRSKLRRRVRILRINHLADVIRVQNGAASKLLAAASMSAGDKVIWVSEDGGAHTISFDFPEGSPFAGSCDYSLPANGWVESRPIAGSAKAGDTYRYHIYSRLSPLADPGVRIDP